MNVKDKDHTDASNYFMQINGICNLDTAIRAIDNSFVIRVSFVE